MTAILETMESPHATRLGLTLLHFVWQGTLVAIGAKLALFSLRRHSSNARYVVLVFSFSALAACPLLTFSILRTDPTPSKVGVTSERSGDSPTTSSAALFARDSERLRVSDDSVLPSKTWSAVWIPRSAHVTSAVWLVGVALLSLRLVAGLLRVEHLRRRACGVPDQIERLAARLCRDLNLRRPVRILCSTRCRVPTTIGALRPVILLPLEVLTGLSSAQLELILVHELSHVRRFDYLVNLFQVILETLFFYHPAVWWMSRRLRAEREFCCDDFAIVNYGDRVEYARALLACENLRGASAGFGVASTGGSLRQRIARILGASTDSQLRLSLLPVFAIALASLTLGVVFSVAAESRNEVSARTTSPTTLALRIVDGDSGEPIGRVAVASSSRSDPYEIETSTNSEGYSELLIPPGNATRFTVYCRKAGFVPMRVTWNTEATCLRVTHWHCSPERYAVVSFAT